METTEGWDHEQAYRAVQSVEKSDRRAPHNWIGYHWVGEKDPADHSTACDSVWALMRSGLPLTRQSAQRMLTAALMGHAIAGLRCITPIRD